jgi:hypothetical protein
MKPPVKLVGQDGNVFNVIGLCKRAARMAGWSPAQTQEFTARCFSAGSYDEVLQIVLESFEVE